MTRGSTRAWSKQGETGGGRNPTCLFLPVLLVLLLLLLLPKALAGHELPGIRYALAEEKGKRDDRARVSQRSCTEVLLLVSNPD